MTKEYIKEIPNWEKDYLKIMGNDLTAQQLELLKGRDIKSPYDSYPFLLIYF